MPQKKPESLEAAVTRMADGAAALVAETREQSKKIKLVLTARQFLVGMIVFVIGTLSVVVAAGLLLNQAGEDRTTATQEVIVATIKCLGGRVPPDKLDRCISDVRAGAPPPTTSTTREAP